MRGQGPFSGYLSELFYSERCIQYLFNFKNLLKGKKFIELTNDTLVLLILKNKNIGQFNFLKWAMVRKCGDWEIYKWKHPVACSLEISSVPRHTHTSCVQGLYLTRPATFQVFLTV